LFLRGGSPLGVLKKLPFLHTMQLMEATDPSVMVSTAIFLTAEKLGNIQTKYHSEINHYSRATLREVESSTE